MSMKQRTVAFNSTLGLMGDKYDDPDVEFSVTKFEDGRFGINIRVAGLSVNCYATPEDMENIKVAFMDILFDPDEVLEHYADSEV